LTKFAENEPFCSLLSALNYSMQHA